MSVIDVADVDEFPSRAKLDPQWWADRLLAAVDRCRIAIFLVLGLCLIGGFNGQWQIEPDSALYLVLARNIVQGHGYTYHGQPHALAYPGLPYALAGIARVFGDYHIIADNAFILLCGALALALTYRLVLLAFDRPTAVIVTLGVGLSHEFFRYCYEIMTDVPALVGVMAFLAGHQAIFGRKIGGPINRPARWWDWMLLIGGLGIAISMRPTSIGLLIAWVIALTWSSFRRQISWRRSLSAIGLVAAMLLIFLWLDPRKVSGDASLQSYERYAAYGLTHNFDARLMLVLANLKDLFGLTAARAVFGMPLGAWWINAIVGTVVIVIGIALIRRQVLWGLWIMINIAMLVFFVSHDRYIVQILPLLVLAWWLTIRSISRRLPKRKGNLVFAVFLLFGALPNAVQSAGVILHQHYTPFLAYYKEGRFPPYLSAAKAIRTTTTRQDTIVSQDKFARILTFWSGRNVTEPSESPDLSNRTVYVVQDPSDEQFSKWLESRNLTRIGPPLAIIPRNASGTMPLLLWRGNAQPASP
jgi:hypothetical protein